VLVRCAGVARARRTASALRRFGSLVCSRPAPHRQPNAGKREGEQRQRPRFRHGSHGLEYIDQTEGRVLRGPAADTQIAFLVVRRRMGCHHAFTAWENNVILSEEEQHARSFIWPTWDSCPSYPLCN